MTEPHALDIHPLALGEFAANAHIVADPQSGQCVVVDATWDAPRLLAAIDALPYTLTAIWTTHAHLDHIGAIAAVMDSYPGIALGLHRTDLPLYNIRGGADWFGIPLQQPPPPTLWFDEHDHLMLGDVRFEILFVPGHAPGHVAFYQRERNLLFGGDVLFAGSIGRTDLPLADHATLMHSIQTEFLTLPDETTVYPGHGPATTIGIERLHNPFL